MPGFPACQIRTHHQDTHGSFFARALLNPLMSRWVCTTTASSLHVYGFAPKKNDDSEGEKGEAARGHRSCGGGDGLSGPTGSEERRRRGWRRDGTSSPLETVALAASSSSLFVMSRRPVRSSCCWLRRHQESACV